MYQPIIDHLMDNVALVTHDAKYVNLARVGECGKITGVFLELRDIELQFEDGNYSSFSARELRMLMPLQIAPDRGPFEDYKLDPKAAADMLLAHAILMTMPSDAVANRLQRIMAENGIVELGNITVDFWLERAIKVFDEYAPGQSSGRGR